MLNAYQTLPLAVSFPEASFFSLLPVGLAFVGSFVTAEGFLGLIKSCNKTGDVSENNTGQS